MTASLTSPAVQHIESKLNETGATVTAAQLAADLGFAPNTVSKGLSFLAKLGRIHSYPQKGKATFYSALEPVSDNGEPESPENVTDEDEETQERAPRRGHNAAVRETLDFMIGHPNFGMTSYQVAKAMGRPVSSTTNALKALVARKQIVRISVEPQAYAYITSRVETPEPVPAHDLQVGLKVSHFTPGGKHLRMVTILEINESEGTAQVRGIQNPQLTYTTSLDSLVVGTRTPVAV